MVKLIYEKSPTVTLATNKFIDVPIILQFDDTPLISIVKKQYLGYTTQIPIYHPDGTYLAKVNGTRIYPTKDGENVGLVMEHPAHMTVCKMGNKTLSHYFTHKYKKSDIPMFVRWFHLAWIKILIIKPFLYFQ